MTERIAIAAVGGGGRAGKVPVGELQLAGDREQPQDVIGAHEGIAGQNPPARMRDHAQLPEDEVGIGRRPGEAWR